MRRAVWIGVLALALLAVSATPSHAWRGGGSGGGSGNAHGGGSWRGGSGWHGGHVHGRFFVGPRFWGGAPYWWGAPYPYWGYYGAPYYAYPPPVVVEEQTYAQAAPEPTPAAPQQPKAYWYYCASARAYYPTAPTCPEVWIKVPPRSEQ